MKTSICFVPRNTHWAVMLTVAVSIIIFTLGICGANESELPAQPDPEAPQLISSPEGYWPLLSISGGISLNFSAYQGRLPGEIVTEEGALPFQPFATRTQIGAENRLSLILDAVITDRISAYARLGGNSLWGVNYSGELALAPIATSSLMTLEEFAASYHTRNSWISAGKQLFGLGPLGLMVCNTTTPIDLISASVANNIIGASAIAGRLSSEYYLGTDYVINTDDYIAVRVENQLIPNVLVGFNYLVSGVGDSSGQSLDLQSSILGRSFAIEAARYNPGSTITEDRNKDSYAWLARVDLVDSPAMQASVAYGRAGKGFTPAFSSIASSSGATESLTHNSHNLTLDVSRVIGSGLSLAGQVSVSRFLDQEFAEQTSMDKIYPLLSASITASKQIAPYSAINATIEHVGNESVNYRRFGLGLQLNF